MTFTDVAPGLGMSNDLSRDDGLDMYEKKFADKYITVIVLGNLRDSHIKIPKGIVYIFCSGVV